MRYFLITLFLSLNINADVKNNVGFIGQRILGSSVGAPLSVDANNGLISGIQGTTAVSAATTITTTSTTDIVMTGITITPVSGTYKVMGTTTFRHNTNNALAFLSVWAAGVQIASSQSSATPQPQAGVGAALSIDIPATSIAEVSVNGSQAVELRWRTSAGTATSVNRVLTIQRIR